MPWMTLKDKFKQIREGTQSYLSPLMSAKGMRLTEIASAVYHYEPFEHFRQGFSQIFYAPLFVLNAEETRDLAWRSFVTNVCKYLVPAILYARAVPTLRQSKWYESSPENMEYVLLLPYAVILYELSRMLQRRLETNGEYNYAYNRVIKKDIDKLLPHTLAKELANELTEILNHKFKTTHPTKTISLHLFGFLYNEFEKFFKKSDIHAETFYELKNPLSHFLNNTLNQYYLTDQFSFCNQLTNEFLTILAEDFCAKANTEKSMENTLITDEMRERLVRAKKSVQHFLPVSHYPHCSCKEMIVFMGKEFPSPEFLRRASLAEISSVPYSIGKKIFTFIPEILAFGAKISQEAYLAMFLLTILIPRALYFSQVISQRLQSRIELAGYFSLVMLFTGHFIPPDVIVAMQWIGFFARWLLAGQIQIDLLILSHCTRHRTEITSRNKWYAFGIGASIATVAEFFAQIVFLTTNVRNTCTDLAIFELVTQASTVATLGYKIKLPGTGEHTWNLFYVPQRMMRFVLDKLNDKLQKPKPPEEVLRDLQKIGRILGIYAWITFGPGTFFPKLPIDMSKTSVQNFLLKHETLRYLLHLCRQDIEFYLSYLKSAQTFTNIISKPAHLVAQSSVVLFIAILSKLLNDEALVQLLEKIQTELKAIEIEEANKIQVIEDTSDDEVVTTPALANIKTVAELTYKDEPIRPETQKLLEADIADALQDNPVIVDVKKPKPMNLLSGIRDSYFVAEPVKKPKVIKVDPDGYGWVEAGNSFPVSPLQKNCLLRGIGRNKKLNSTPDVELKKISGLNHR